MCRCGDDCKFMYKEKNCDYMCSNTCFALVTQMYNSLRQIRHSATRKKVDKIFETLDTYKQQSTSSKKQSRSPSPAADSGISSKMSTLRSERDDTDSAKPSPAVSKTR